MNRKIMKLLTVLGMALMAMMTLNACLGDDTDTKSQAGLSAQEKAQCLAMVKGDYTGRMFYYALNEKDLTDQTDTLDISWSITNDSTLIIKQFPNRLLGNEVSSSSLKAAIATLPDADLECRIGFVKVSPVQFLVNPKTVSNKLMIDGAEHLVQIVFYANNVYSFGSYDASLKMMEMKIVEAAIFLDGQQTGYLTSGTPFLFISDAG